MRHVIMQAHEERCTDIGWHPQALCPDADGTTRSPDALAFATASADGTAKLWNMHGTCLHTCSGHARRLARLAFNPTGAIRCMQSARLPRATTRLDWKTSSSVATSHCVLYN
jgi:WD40 repeat protein